MPVGNYECIHGNQNYTVTTPGIQVVQVSGPANKKVLSAGYRSSEEGTVAIETDGQTITFRVANNSIGSANLSYWLTVAEMC